MHFQARAECVHTRIGRFADALRKTQAVQKATIVSLGSQKFMVHGFQYKGQDVWQR